MKEFITASASLDVWEVLFQTEFFEWTDADNNDKTFIRAQQYSLHEDISRHVRAVFNTVQTPPVISSHAKMRSQPKKEKTTKRWSYDDLKTDRELFPSPHLTDSSYVYDGDVTVGYLNSLYSIPGSNAGSPSVTQSVFEASTEYYSTTDLAAFQSKYNLPLQDAIPVHGHSTTTCPSASTNTMSCFEGNLDIQYIMGVAPLSPSYFWYISGSNADVFLKWILDVAGTTNPPLVHSISWGSYEHVSEIVD